MALTELNPPVYDNFNPPTEVVLEKDCDTILLNLPDFRKENLKVQLTTSKFLRISGSRQIDVDKWKKFQKEFPVKPDYDTQKITAKFEGGILYVRLPKLVPPLEEKEAKQDTKLSAPVTAPQKSSVQEQTSEKPAAKDDSAEQTNAQNVKEEPKVLKEKNAEPTEPENQAKNGGLDNNKDTIAGDKGEDEKAKKSPEEKTSGLDDSKKKSIAGNEGEDDRKGTIEKREKESSGTLDGSDKTRDLNYKETIVDVLKKHRKMFNVSLGVIFALALGIYITTFIGSLRRSEN